MKKHAQARRAGAQIRACPSCGKEVTGAKRTYCSEQCVPSGQRLSYAEKKARRPLALCEACGQQYRKHRRTQRWCSMACSNRSKPGGGPRGGLSPEARERRRLYWQEKNRRRRAAKRGGRSEPYTTLEVAERDRFRCGLCGKRVAMNAKVPSPKAPTIDHIVPLLEGGNDTRANVQLAHFHCNSAKGSRGSQQLALLG